jgi:hypothetical protein
MIASRRCSLADWLTPLAKPPMCRQFLAKLPGMALVSTANQSPLASVNLRAR